MGEPKDAVILEKETARYQLRYAYSARRGRHELSLASLDAGRNFSVHTRFNLLSDAGEVLGARAITPDIARFILDNFEARGDTASFDIFETDLDAGRLLARATPTPAPAEVRHLKTAAEQSFTATGAKLAHHAPIFAKLRDTGFASIIRATLTLHQVCGSSCHYCSTLRRNRADAITLAEAQAFVETLYEDQARFNRERFADHNRAYRVAAGSDIRLRGLILSGGGQPNLWPHFADFVHWLAKRDIDLGLITNGFPPGIDADIYGRFKWVRISITPDDASPHYPEGRFEDQYIPESLKNNPQVTVGYSYVFGPWTDDGVLLRMGDALAENGFDYCRTLADCNLGRAAQLQAHRALGERLHRLGLTGEDGAPKAGIFHQLKYHGEATAAAALWDEGQCYLQAYNVFWDTTGHEADGYSFCYPCDSVTVLADDAEGAPERRFNRDIWGTVPNTEVHRLFSEPLRPFFDPRERCAACLFMDNNRTVKALASGAPVPPVPAGLKHLNFP